MVNRVYRRLEAEPGKEQSERQERHVPDSPARGKEDDAGEGHENKDGQAWRGKRFVVPVAGRAVRVRRQDGRAGHEQRDEHEKIHAARLALPVVMPPICCDSVCTHGR